MDAEKLVEDLTGRVRDAIAQAEERARAIVDEAQERARTLVADAEAEAQRIRERAEAEAEQGLARVRDALSGLEGALGSSPDAEVDPRPAPMPEPTPQPMPEPTPPTEPEPMPPAEPEPMPPSPEIVPPAPAQPERQPPAAEPATAVANGGAAKGDEIGARIVATKMALDGSSRDEIAAHLAEHYEVSNPDDLLDFAMARAKR